MPADLLAAAERQAAPGSRLAQASGLPDETVLLYIDGREIPAWRYLYWLAEDCRRTESQYTAAGKVPEWTAPLPDGETLEEKVKSAALADTALYAAVETLAQTYGCALTQQERGALPARTYPDLTPEQSQILAEIGGQYAKLYRLAHQADSPLAPAEGELALLASDPEFLAAEGIRVPLGADAAAARQKIGDLFAQINGAAAPEEVFDALLETDGGLLAETEWTPALREAAAALAPGQISGILETETGFFILRRRTVDAQTLRDAWFDRLVQSTADAAEIQCTEAYKALRPVAFWQALQALEDR